MQTWGPVRVGEGAAQGWGAVKVGVGSHWEDAVWGAVRGRMREGILHRVNT